MPQVMEASASQPSPAGNPSEVMSKSAWSFAKQSDSNKGISLQNSILKSIAMLALFQLTRDGLLCSLCDYRDTILAAAFAS